MCQNVRAKRPNRQKCSFLIFFNAPNMSNLITVTCPDLYFSFLEMHIDFVFVTNNVDDAIY